MSQIAGSVVEFVEKYHDVMDPRSKNACRIEIVEALHKHRLISIKINDADARKEFDSLFADEVNRAEAALELISEDAP